MDPEPSMLVGNLILILILVVLNGFFVAAEFAIVKVRSSSLDSFVQIGNEKAKRAVHLIENIESYLSVCQLGITLTSLGLGWLGVPVMIHIFATLFPFHESYARPVFFILGFAFIAFLHIVFGELLPKTAATYKYESVMLWITKPMNWIRTVFSPLIWFLNKTTNLFLRPFGITLIHQNATRHTEEEIRILVKESHKEGIIDHTKLTLVDNVLEFSDTCARQIMIPRTDMICLYVNAPFQTNREMAKEKIHTRYPVAQQDKDVIIGFVHIKDLLKVPDDVVLDIRELIRPIITVPEGMSISILLKMMQKKKSQIAILVDEYGGTSGLVTLEDIMEEIVGEIQDEFDEERADLEKINETSYSISGKMLIEEVNHFFGLNLADDDYDTIGGWIYSQVEDNPPLTLQSTVSEGRYRFTIEEIDNLRISRITVECSTENAAWKVKSETG